MGRVVITGLGVTSCLGSDLESYWAGLMRADSMPVEVSDARARMDNKLLYEIRDFTQSDPPPGIDRLGRTSTFAISAARQAWADAGLEPTGGVAIGTGVGDTSLPENGGSVDYTFQVSGVLAREFGLTGPVTSVSTACSASAYSVSLAAEMIRSGQADVMLAGGADGYTRVGVACFNRMGALDPVRCRPFDAQRKGTVFGEGAALMVLESEEHAAKRGKSWYAAVEGAGWSCDAFHPTAPDEGGRQIVRAMREALTEAGDKPVGCVIPHGTGTPLNDAVEGKLLSDVLGDLPPIYSLKGLLGHTGGAAGSFALLTGALIIGKGLVPPNMAVSEPDVITLPTQAQPLPAERVLVNAYAFGGNNISVVIGR